MIAFEIIDTVWNYHALGKAKEVVIIGLQFGQGVELSGPTYASPLLVNKRIFIGDNSGNLQVYGSDSGDLLWSAQLEREIQGRPLRWLEMLLVGSRDHKVHAFTLSGNDEESRND